MRLIWRLLINAAAVWVAAYVIPGIDFDGEWTDLLIVAAIFGLVNAFIRPIVKLLTLPVTLVTLGLFTIVINGFMVMITTWLMDSLSLTGSFFEQFLVAILASLVISVVSIVLSWVLPDGK